MSRALRFESLVISEIRTPEHNPWRRSIARRVVLALTRSEARQLENLAARVWPHSGRKAQPTGPAVLRALLAVAEENPAVAAAVATKVRWS